MLEQVDACTPALTEVRRQVLWSQARFGVFQIDSEEITILE